MRHNVIIHGKQGSGKTTLARKLIKLLGITRWLNQSYYMLDNQDKLERTMANHNFYDVVVIDEVPWNKIKDLDISIRQMLKAFQRYPDTMVIFYITQLPSDLGDSDFEGFQLLSTN